MLHRQLLGAPGYKKIYELEDEDNESGFAGDMMPALISGSSQSGGGRKKRHRCTRGARAPSSRRRRRHLSVQRLRTRRFI